ncbi:hypothetical protein EDC05_000240 [Coemansia umbellata]|uniref:Uncharacterized protein n=1 Tax=Coemansia umbellata TaxID=1424467 RepID=A0ABQ8PXU8_9FUNG|nr:hypothetical protein EDC05_000240 [Coemansia umbellata]
MSVDAQANADTFLVRVTFLNSTLGWCNILVNVLIARDIWQPVNNSSSNSEESNKTDSHFYYYNDSATATRIHSNLELLPHGLDGIPRSLILSIRYGHSLSNMLSQLIGVDIGRIEALARGFVKIVGSPSSIECINVVHEVTGKLFLQNIAKLYALQLRKIIAKASVFDLVPALSESMTELKIACFSSNRIPNISPKKLRKLALSDMDEQFLWSAFEDRDNPGHIAFTSLKRLDIDYKHPIRSDNNSGITSDLAGIISMFPFKVYAPNLKALSVRLCSYTCSLLMATEFPNILPQATLFFSPAMRLSMYNFRVDDRVKAVFERFASGNFVDCIEFATSILNISDVVEKADVVILKELDTAEINRIDWNCVSTLVITSSVSFSDLLSIIHSLPTLVELEAHSIIAEFDSNGISVIPELNSQQAILSEPIDTKLRDIVLGFESNYLFRCSI